MNKEVDFGESVFGGAEVDYTLVLKAKKSNCYINKEAPSDWECPETEFYYCTPSNGKLHADTIRFKITPKEHNKSFQIKILLNLFICESSDCCMRETITIQHTLVPSKKEPNASLHKTYYYSGMDSSEDKTHEEMDVESEKFSSLLFLWASTGITGHHFVESILQRWGSISLLIGVIANTVPGIISGYFGSILYELFNHYWKSYFVSGLFGFLLLLPINVSLHFFHLKFKNKTHKKRSNYSIWNALLLLYCYTVLGYWGMLICNVDQAFSFLTK
eukprot:TRINITY_DN27173_c0_g1_i1.p1 TRINITY_DN27173_c0_g1~~TRINITY_DN27173_c0_g1_i1.p1  ORF type:complete len:274 (-),score=61.22 TRINITY_DN27173_c0_g1_i1:24-845(-)